MNGTKSMHVWLVAAVVGVMAFGSVRAEEVKVDDIVQKLLHQYGAATYAHKDKYGAGIDGMWLGYDTDGNTVVGIASRNTKTYTEALALIAVTPEGESYKVAAAEIPTIGAFRGKSQSYTKDALKDISGRVFEDTKAARGLVDAVTGATKYYKAIYVSYALMASKVMEELQAGADWPQRPVVVQ